MGIDDISRMGGFRFTEKISGEFINCEASLRVPPLASVRELMLAAHDVEFADDSVNSEFEVLETHNGQRHVRFTDGSEAYVDKGLSDEEIMAEALFQWYVEEEHCVAVSKSRWKSANIVTINNPFIFADDFF